MHTVVRMKLLLVLLMLDCMCASADVWEFFGPKLRSRRRSLENENAVHDYVVSTCSCIHLISRNNCNKNVDVILHKYFLLIANLYCTVPSTLIFF